MSNFKIVTASQAKTTYKYKSIKRRDLIVMQTSSSINSVSEEISSPTI